MQSNLSLFASASIFPSTAAASIGALRSFAHLKTVLAQQTTQCDQSVLLWRLTGVEGASLVCLLINDGRSVDSIINLNRSLRSRVIASVRG